VKYTKRDEFEYEAFHYRGLEDLDELKKFVPELYRSIYNEGLVNARPQLVITTTHGPIALRDSEYVVKGQDGSFSIYTADTFARLFTQVVVDGEDVSIAVDSVGAAASTEDDPIKRAVRALEEDQR
jgi:hypothetical protein